MHTKQEILTTQLGGIKEMNQDTEPLTEISVTS